VKAELDRRAKTGCRQETIGTALLHFCSLTFAARKSSHEVVREFMDWEQVSTPDNEDSTELMGEAIGDVEDDA